MHEVRTVLSFDIEEHHRIEAAAAYDCPADLRREYADRMERSTRALLDLLAKHNAAATFFIVGEIAHTHPELVKDIQAAGHEIGSHSWDHRRVHRFTPETFAQDLKQSRDALEQATGAPVLGFRAPTFSIVRETGWAIDVLAECGFTYDSSIFPVRHDRYGIADAPRTPFKACGQHATLLELPPTTWRFLNQNLPVAGGGYFRLFPRWMMEAGIRQVKKLEPAAAMLYFHPWEFDADQPRLPLSRLSRWRTYVGTGSSLGRLDKLLGRHRFCRAIDLADQLRTTALPEFHLKLDPSHLVN